MLKFKAFIFEKLGIGFMLVLVGAFLWVGAKLLSQCLFWLQNGYWQPYSILSLLRDLDWKVPRAATLLGLQKIIDGVLAWPAAIGVLGFGFLCALIGAYLIATAEHYHWEDQQHSESKLLKARDREEREHRRAAAERSKKDFNFDQQVNDVVRRRQD